MRDPYELLAVPRSATADEIKKSFRRLAKELHPDANKYDPEASARFAELNGAHEILGDEETREAFDRGKVGADGKLIRPVVSLAKTRKQNIAANLMRGMLAATVTLIVRSSTPAENINAAGERIASVWSDLRADEEQASGVETEPRDYKAPSEPRLILQPNVFHTIDGTVPLGIQVSGEVVGLSVQINRLPTGVTISSGRAYEAGWRVLATELVNATIHPPAGFSGPIVIAVELRLTNNTVVDHGLFRFEWLRTPTDTSVPTESAGNLTGGDTTASNVIATPVLADQRAIDAGQSVVELLIGRSQQLISEGDTEAARMLLQPAAEAHDARAALALGATYDPFMLTILHAHGVPADVPLALDWYKKASQFGSRTAQQRLNLLHSVLTTFESTQGMIVSDHSRTLKPKRHVVWISRPRWDEAAP
jgi:hypothetical protein